MELTGIEMSLFRAPYGDYNKVVLDTAKECGYYAIQWDIDVYATTLKPGNTRA
jgi:peptidoglycan/xylan/chitin deacetylase (PgdA/CDA1 family)